MLEKLKEIIEELKKIRNETKIKLSDNVLFENAVKIYNTQYIQNSNKIPFKNKPDENIEEPATDKQKNYLEKLGYEGKADMLSKEEAKQLIKEYIENQKGENY